MTVRFTTQSATDDQVNATIPFFVFERKIDQEKIPMPTQNQAGATIHNNTIERQEFEYT